MDRKTHMDAFGAGSLIAFALLLAFNQVVVKVANAGLQPAFFAGLRSVGAVVCVGLWLWWRGIPLKFPNGALVAGIIAGLCFAAEFLFLFIALDLTTVARSGIMFYSMPLWMAVIAHFVLPDDRVTPTKALGLLLALGGVAVALLGRGADSEGSLWGDLAGIGGAIGWAVTALMAKASPLRHARPEVQLWIQVLVSGPILILAAPLFGPLIRDLEPIHLWALAFQIVVVVSAGFIFWLWLLSIYPASGVASFSFLSPVFSVLLGWLVLGEEIRPVIVVALVLVAAGILLINRPPKRA
ncbi:MAG: DMT family transporter [Rhodobacteraceae bacterium]|nr:DMT family transporter [Paracoccaceae bacterium]